MEDYSAYIENILKHFTILDDYLSGIWLRMLELI